jgi:P27 family predicted phage terminase small subunit
LKLIQGNPGKRPINRREPKFTGAPVCPAWLTNVAKIEWKRVVLELESLDMLRAVDTAALAAYCVSYARWKSAEAIVDLQGQTVSEPILSKTGKVPSVAMASQERSASWRRESPRWRGQRISWQERSRWLPRAADG